MAKQPLSLRHLLLRALQGSKPKKRQHVTAELLGDVGEDEKKQVTYAINRAIKHMQEQGDLTVHRTAFSKFLQLTDQGRKKLTTMQLASDTVLLPKTWDGMWRLVLLDVPESRKTEREALRYLLQKSRFVCIKNAVWVSPFPLEHLLTQLKDDMDLSTELMVFVTDTVDPKTQDMLLDKFFPASGSFQADSK